MAEENLTCFIWFNIEMVTPVDVVTLSTAASGWFPLSCKSLAAPFAV
jgi:hypothetical protein